MKKSKKSFQDNFPKIAKEFHPSKNKGIDLKNIAPFSNKKIWWKCPKAEDHEWQQIVHHRTSRQNKCPFCANLKLSKDNSLLNKFPKISEEWHVFKNKDLKPEQVIFSSSENVWWQCKKNADHQWQATIRNRTVNKSGCPFCSGRIPTKENNFELSFPDIAKEWHPTKNKNLQPNAYTPSSNKKVWWKCKEGDDHEWEASISNRSRGRGCPFCSGKKVSKTNNLAYLFPDIAKEWHPTKNKKLKPHQVTPGQSTKVWWKCLNKINDHEWKSSINNRTRGEGRGCPYCNNNTSRQEIRVFTEILKIFGKNNVEWKKRIENNEIDIFIKDLNIGIEYDGYYWHKNRLKNDKNKNKFFKSKGIKIIRFREKPLKLISKDDVSVYVEGFYKNNINDLLANLLKSANKKTKFKIKKYQDKTNFINEGEYKKILSFLPSPPKGYSFKDKHPKVSLNWDYEKNYPLKPEYFSSGSGKEVWWKCPQGADHKWKAAIYSVAGSEKKKTKGCPFCSSRRVSKSNSFQENFSDISKEWHPTKNKNLTPDQVTYGSQKKVWWQCKKNSRHEWEAVIANRSKGKGCPFCSGRRKL